jgi:phage FluMu protein Com
MAVTDSRRRVEADRHVFLDYKTACPFCKASVGPRSVTREHLDVPPNPPYAATVKCPKCGEVFEVVFKDQVGADRQ